ncbi:Putative flippase GtrA (transmembrane translocase of bactoprenol-linked glucose) [Ferrimonas sediminum]|uniref:Putative flippase GtrA (Transmembrane translocase of bactoprenol-linked glucose) n=1 Tax=Ferrimonas sediminum TaxID=718193 RepID=A0A1G8WX30_9GAMM|nr:GtrA family protein [Ferrimonas sediminum]SDJ82942.1 Putative flippase GtrA (transmembrane translocase of bactoprenol-linked glucose) [Ferrimonas sediminum]
MRWPAWIKFALVGGTGFVVDLSLFSALTLWLEWGPYPARGLAFVAAASTTWAGNRCFTFRQRRQQNARTQWLKSVTAALMSALPNFGLFSLTLMLLSPWPLAPWAALVTGIGAGTVSNYLLSSHWVFAESARSL